ncbi:MAG TPA: DUF3179 domain-containing (seleno)protein, partial [Isosphaeraceae bacterium]|nr:DUF3179 domain-containing (seleno)protein [Isosphaeraceae bacterium]
MTALSLALTLLVLEPADEPAQKSLFRPEMFQTLVDPDCSYCHVESKRAGESLRPADRVLAWIRGQHDGGAIPYRFFLVPHRVISDSYGVFVYDPDADFVRGWPPSYDFRFHGWRNGVMVMSHKDGTLFDCLTGKAFDGPRKGEQLQPLPTLETNWGPWLKANPGTVAYTMKPQFTPVDLPTAVLAESRQTRPQPDGRLDPDERVFGLSIGGESCAWPLKSLGAERRVLSVSLGGERAALMWEPATKTAVAFAQETEAKLPQQVHIERVDPSNPEAPFVDSDTHSHWSTTGRCLAGERKGQSLRW